MGGGRSLGGKGKGLGGGSGGAVNIVQTMDVWSFRHRQENAPFVDAINTGVQKIADDFPGVMDDVNAVDAAQLGGKDALTTLGFYSPQGKTVALNRGFTDVDKMNATMDAAAASGFHPSRGNLTGTEAVALHEMGHALTDSLGKKIGAADIDGSAKIIVSNAYKASGAKGGTYNWAGGISKYAQHSYAEAIAEACTDWYCNGSKASGASKAIMAEMMRIQAL